MQHGSVEGRAPPEGSLPTTSPMGASLHLSIYPMPPHTPPVVPRCGLLQHSPGLEILLVHARPSPEQRVRQPWPQAPLPHLGPSELRGPPSVVPLAPFLLPTRGWTDDRHSSREPSVELETHGNAVRRAASPSCPLPQACPQPQGSKGDERLPCEVREGFLEEGRCWAPGRRREEAASLTGSLVPWGVSGRRPAAPVGVPSAASRLPQPEAPPDVSQQGVDDTHFLLLPAALPD